MTSHESDRAGRPDSPPGPAQGAVPDLGGRGGDQGRHPRRRSRPPRASGSARARRWPRASAIRPTRRRDAGTTWPARSRPACSAAPSTRVEDIAAIAVGLERRAGSPSAGAETALWDLLGQARHATIAELLGASTSRSTWGSSRAWPSGSIPAIVELLKTIETHLEEGYRRVKIKIQPGQDVELVRAVRQHFGDVPLMVDANGAYTAADIDIFRELDEFDLLMFEQPMAAGRPRRPGRAPAGGHARRSAWTRRPTTPRADRRGDPAGRLPDRQPQAPARRRSRPGPGHPRPLLPARRRLLGRRHARARHRPGPRHPPGDPGQLQVPDRRRAVRPLVRRRLRRSAARARRPGALQRPDPSRPGIPGRPGQAPSISGPPGGSSRPARPRRVRNRGPSGRSAIADPTQRRVPR